jgi:hypothetical protein
MVQTRGRSVGMADRNGHREPNGSPIEAKSATSGQATVSPPANARSTAMNFSFETAGFEELVRARAYALWESEGRPAGRDAEHWRLSEAEMRRALTQVEAETEAAKPAKPKPAKLQADKPKADKPKATESEASKPKATSRKPPAKITKN